MASKAAMSAPPMTLEEEDNLIHARILNDEKPLRRLTKKFHAFSSVACSNVMGHTPLQMSVDEAREAFLIEMSAFQLQLRKTQLVCSAESRQGEIYRNEKTRIENERARLRNEIEELKSDLENAQLERRRKIEYDQIAEKINNLPTRDELELSITALENDMQVIRDEQEAQESAIVTQKVALDAVVADLGRVLLSGKRTDDQTDMGDEQTDGATPAIAMDVDEGKDGAATEFGSQTGAEESSDSSIRSLNPSAKAFAPSRSTSTLLQTATSQLRMQKSASANPLVGSIMSREATPVTPTGGISSNPSSRGPGTPREDGEDGETEEGEAREGTEDIEMGEVSEKTRREDREEGEASDGSSDLSEPPED